ncbi:MAG: hypothetical protein AAFO77_07235, partial [Pseudomonadota bacterium]
MGRVQTKFRIWVGAGVALGAFALVLALVVLTAAKQAGSIVAENERNLITQEIARELVRSRELQSDLSYWDE